MRGHGARVGLRATVHAHVAVGPNAAEEELNAPVLPDGHFVAEALGLEVCRIAVRDEHVLGLWRMREVGVVSRGVTHPATSWCAT